MAEERRKYQPSNGTEGCGFIECYCLNCINEKFMHTQKHGDLQCDILNRTMLFNVKDKEYPEEWTYNEEGNPICTAFKKFDWGSDDDEDGLNEPPPLPTDDPNQLCLPFLFDEIGVPKTEPELNHSIS